MREDELEKNLQPFLAYLAQTPVNELLNDYTYQLVFIGHDLSKSTVAKLLSTALDALEVPDAAASMPGGV